MTVVVDTKQMGAEAMSRLVGFLSVLLLLPLLSGCFPKSVLQVPSEPPQQRGDAAVQGQLLTQYERWKGTPYRAGGEDRAGFDCSGFVRTVYRDAFRLDLPRTSADQSRLGQNIRREEIRAGDILYFIDRGYDHVGIALEPMRFMHSSTSRGVIMSELDGYWSPRLLRVRRILN